MGYQNLLIMAGMAALVHVVEEYKADWVKWANGFVSGVTVKLFMIINLLFILLCIIAATLHEKYIVFTSSIFSLLLANSLVHIVPTIKQMKYSPGLVSAVLLFIPIGIAGYAHLLSNELITNKELIVSIVIGAVWMSVPFVYQIVWLVVENRVKS